MSFPEPSGAIFGLLWRRRFFLRVGVAVSSDWIYRIDETLEYLEQAHRLVFGYGIVPWNIVTAHVIGWRSCRPLQR